jgi:XTP/dITP diphosphohydrolase
MNLLVATTNKGKLREFQEAVEQLGFGGVTIGSLGLPADATAPEETGDTFEANAVIKALAYSRHTDALVFADDSGLQVDALDGAPGILSARFAGPGATDKANNDLLLAKLQQETTRTCRYVCVIALARAGNLLGTFHGEMDGEVLRQPQGEGGFGYDPVFFYPPLQRSAAELTREEKIRVSHRGSALRQMLSWLTETDAGN